MTVSFRTLPGLCLAFHRPGLHESESINYEKIQMLHVWLAYHNKQRNNDFLCSGTSRQ